jgi:hypothetical protein
MSVELNQKLRLNFLQRQGLPPILWDIDTRGGSYPLFRWSWPEKLWGKFSYFSVDGESIKI